MTLSWTQDCVGPLCRYAEDCAIVMRVIAKPDGRDMSVTDVPFNWNAGADVRRLRVGYVKESFDELTDETAKRNAAATLATLATLGVAEIVPVQVPSFPFKLGSSGVESTAFFDEHARAGRLQGVRSGGATSGHLMPAVEYLRLQRIRMMMMMRLAEATAHVDVYIVAANNSGKAVESLRRAAAARTGGSAAPAAADSGREPSVRQRHFVMATLAGYPAVNLPNGFGEAGLPTNAVLYAQPYREMAVLALAKALQDKTSFHRRTPLLDVAKPAATGVPHG
jgi:Asp-tRNA(Asn)/Glu-tRNA(Gln) amidotransferase A subunit family amidase